LPGDQETNGPPLFPPTKFASFDGHQRFRAYPDGKKELQDVPFPPVNTVMVPVGEWSDLPGMVGTKLRLKIRQAADVLEHYELSGKWKDYQAVVTYGWLQRANESPRLIPLSISTQAHFNKKLYWRRGRFTAYKVFSRHRPGPVYEPSGSERRFVRQATCCTGPTRKIQQPAPAKATATRMTNAQ
jgi:hypothetical protein